MRPHKESTMNFRIIPAALAVCAFAFAAQAQTGSMSGPAMEGQNHMAGQNGCTPNHMAGGAMGNGATAGGNHMAGGAMAANDHMSGGSTGGAMAGGGMSGGDHMAGGAMAGGNHMAANTNCQTQQKTTP
jgi:hypothetical protein